MAEIFNFWSLGISTFFLDIFGWKFTPFFSTHHGLNMPS